MQEVLFPVFTGCIWHLYSGFPQVLTNSSEQRRSSPMRYSKIHSWVVLGLACLTTASLPAWAADKSGLDDQTEPASQLQAPVAPGAQVKPGQLFVDGMMSVRAPNATGWIMGAQRGDALAFRKSGKVAGEGYSAQVQLFPLPDDLDHNALVAKIRHDVESDTPKDHFKSIRSDFSYTAQRGYPCVRFSGETEYTPAAGQAPIRLEAQSLYCRHPGVATTGFVVSFVHHGPHADKNLSREAEEFFSGVKVIVSRPDKTAPAAGSGR